MSTQLPSVNGPTSTGGTPVRFLKRGFLDRLLGKCATSDPSDPSCWTIETDRVLIDLKKTPELSKPGGAVRLEGKTLPFRILIVRCDKGFRAFVNVCPHGGRRVDPVPGTETVQCCSMGRSTYDSEGSVIYGPAKRSLKRLEVDLEPEKLSVSIT